MNKSDAAKRNMDKIRFQIKFFEINPADCLPARKRNKQIKQDDGPQETETLADHLQSHKHENACSINYS